MRPDENFSILPNLAEASALPSRFYTEPNFFETEKEKIFFKTWQPVGRSDQVSNTGDYFTAEMAGEPIVVVRGEGGVLRAFSNVCRHRGSLVAEGSGNKKCLQCPYHAWSYHLNGKLSAAPEFQGVQNWKLEDVKLPELKVDIWGAFVFVHLGDGLPALQSVLGNIPNEIKAAGYDFSKYQFLTRTEYVVNCNWKVYVDNYLEGYHIPTVHPALFKELDYQEYRVNTFEYYSSQYAPLRPVKADAKNLRRYDPESGAQKPLYYWVFPNFMINIYPDNIHLNVILPLSVDKTLTLFDWYTLPNSSMTQEEIIKFSDQVQKEDMQICERVQKGLQSMSYDRGRYSVKRENGVHHFHRLIEKFVVGKP